MSLLGRLEDLSLTDIIQIVYLSRRTGVLEIIDSVGRHTVLFRQGLVVNAATPDLPDLVSFLQAEGVAMGDHSKVLRQMEESGIPFGSAVLELNLMSTEELGEAVRRRIAGVVTPLLNSREGEFNFILSDSMTPLDIEYEPDQLFKDGGLPPNKLLGTAEGEKLKPLRGLEESLKAGKALLRGATGAETPPATLPLGLGEERSYEPADSGVGLDVPFETGLASAPEPLVDLDGNLFDHLQMPVTAGADNVVPFPARDEPFAAIEEPDAPFADLPVDLGSDLDPAMAPSPESLEVPVAEPPAPEPTVDEPLTVPAPPRPIKRGSQFRVSGGLFDVESPDAVYRNVVLYERNPMVRVAARRAFTKRSVKIFQYGSLDDVRGAMTELFRSSSFFVTFLELTEDESASVRLLHQLKRKNPRLPVVVIDEDADLRRRHELLRGGADLYLTKPTPARMQPGLVEEELAMFADELVLFAERAFQQWEDATGGGADAGRKFYESASHESVDRSFAVLRQLINELSDPNNIGEVAATILRLAAEYVDRGGLFLVRQSEFIGLGGFGPGIDAQVRQMTIPVSAPSVLADVVSSGEAHRGKIRKTAVNVQLIERFGGNLPTEVIALPITQNGRVIGILYGDNAEHRAPIDSMTGLEIFLSQAGYALGSAVFASERAGRERES
ncbi:MAG: response regulator [Thermoanaerobaculia bacterium]